MRSLPPIRPPFTSEQIETIAIWLAANDQAWIRDVRRAQNGDWSRLSQRVDLLKKPEYEIEDDRPAKIIDTGEAIDLPMSFDDHDRSKPQ